jgi:hypothetical protein
VVVAGARPSCGVAVVRATSRSRVVSGLCAAMLRLPWFVFSLGRVIPRKGVEHAPNR